MSDLFQLKDALKGYHERNDKNLNVAEVKAEEFFKMRNIYYQKVGFDEKNEAFPKDLFVKIPPKLRAMPDYIAINKEATFVEVKGFNDEFKLKENDLKSYEWWMQVLPVMIYAYDFNKQVAVILPFEDLYRDMKLNNNFATGRYHDNGFRYYVIDWKYLNKLKIYGQK